MSDRDIKAASPKTGTFATLKPTAEKGTIGDSESRPGKRLPPAADPDLNELTNELNVSSQAIGRDLRFKVNVESGRSVIQVLDRETGEIIRQIPPEDAQTYVSDLGGVALRLYIDEA